MPNNAHDVMTEEDKLHALAFERAEQICEMLEHGYAEHQIVPHCIELTRLVVELAKSAGPS
jgi:hypothetical protein